MPLRQRHPYPRRIELYAGRERKESALATQAGMHFPDGSPGGSRIPGSKLGMGFIFLMVGSAENETRNLL